MSKRDFKRAEILDYITKTVTVEGYVPSVREICKAVGLLSPATVHYHLNLLNEEGLILKEPNKKRFIKLATPIANEFIRVPVVGKITADLPITAAENIVEYISVPTSKITNLDVFGLIAKGDSMINAGIRDKDILIVSKTNIADNGDIVVALLENEITIKRFYKENKLFRLQPENDAYEPIIMNEIHILGRVIALHRYF